jgi:pyruvate,water dikinase
LEKDPRLGVGRGRFRLETARRLARFALPILARFLRNLLHPQDARARFDADIDNYLAAARLAPVGAERHARLAEIMTFLRQQVGNAFSFLLPRFIPILGPAMGGLTLLTKLTGDPGLALEVTRGLPHNVTTEMDLALWRASAAIRADNEASTFFQSTPPAQLGALYMQEALPTTAQFAIAVFLEQYGMRGVAELNFGQRRWREEPTPLMHTLQSYLQIDPASAPDLLFARGELAAQAAIEKIALAQRTHYFGWLREKLARAAALRIRLLMGARESPKFFAIRAMGISRQALLQVGKEFVAAGTIEQADDLVFLRMHELDQLAREENLDWKALVASRRLAYERELRRRQVPRVLVSDGRTFYEGLGAATDSGESISGSPVSPGVVEGIVHVVLDPRGTQLLPGEILVCPGTDPAWTPLFMTAGGLITEVGGLMTHGSVVAREYGIPAVVGVHQATTRLKDGQRLRLDGASGKIMLL